jgi:hypothetical protein
MSKPYPELIAWLKSRDAQHHEFGEGILLDHLKGTFNLLSKVKQPEPVCLAGLFYPIYDAKIFKAKNVAFDERELVQDLIGKEAEHLVWLSCKLDRSKALMRFCEEPTAAALPLLEGTEISIQEFELATSLPKLLTLECANLLERQVLWRNQWLVPHAQLCGLLTPDGEQPDHAAVEGHMALMLAQAKRALVLELIEGINFQRKDLASSYWWGDNLRTIKAKQAQTVIEAQGVVDPKADVGLVSHYAQAQGLNLLAAAQDIMQKADAFQAKLMATEMLKDTLMADIQRAENFEDIERVRAVLDEKA